ncbi:MAG: Co2+/Mg2+ efflux protein ApaG [Cyclobacteriaceae bacterium]|nr:Co2+/Mg2+ efflux protein ApaG [Cyclobacteriaceae bacterium]MCH8517448.1 Co2+/Mg2+ efflux protein ApaG [Cyclobacteriaceae bacterium]
MLTKTTEGIEVSVETQYEEMHSNPTANHYVFSYRVKISNFSPYTVQLMRRKWFIHDAGSMMRMVEGEGVVGKQPILEPGESHQYISACNLKSPFGKMVGVYGMKKIMDDSAFEVTIPEFMMSPPHLLN